MRRTEACPLPSAQCPLAVVVAMDDVRVWKLS
jgi:hypothetical protein